MLVGKVWAVTLNSILVEGQGDVRWKDLQRNILDKLTYDLGLTFLLPVSTYPFCVDIVITHHKFTVFNFFFSWFVQ